MNETVQPYHYLILEHFITSKRSLIPISIHISIPPSFEPLATTNVLSVSGFILGISYVLEYVAFCISLLLVSMMLTRLAVCSMYQYFLTFLWLINILLYRYTTFGLSTFSWWTFGLFPPFDYCELCCFEHLCQVFVWRYFISLGYILSNGIAGSYGLPTFNFLRNCQTDFQMAAPFYTPTSNVQCVAFLHTLSNTVIVFFFILRF